MIYASDSGKMESPPVIYLTVRGDSHDMVAGFQNGTDDYVVKPFDLAVLHSRILALLRRTENAADTKLFCDDLILDKRKQLSMMAERNRRKPAGVPHSPDPDGKQGKNNYQKSAVRTNLDRSGNYVNDNTLTVTMKRLREKLNHPACLKTIRSFGYRMEDTK